MNANVLVMKKWHIGFFSERKALREQYRLSITQTYFLAILLIFGLGISYVWRLNVNATNGYNIRTLELKRRELVFSENLLDIKIAEAKSLKALQDSPHVHSMINAEKWQFLVMKENQFTFNQ
jgi:hypothetical protein